MLPKPEKGKKLNNNFLSDSEITKESDEVVKAKKLKSKRKIILISLVATAGLSLIFWSAKSIQLFTSSPHHFNLNFHFNLPTFDFKTPAKNSTNISTSDLDKFLSSSNLSAVIFKNGNYSTPVYQFNFSDSTTDFISQLTKIKPTSTSSAVSGLPEGLSYQEKLDSSLYGLIIKLPNEQLIFIIKDNNQSASFSQNISNFINQAYWYSVSLN